MAHCETNSVSMNTTTNCYLVMYTQHRQVTIQTQHNTMEDNSIFVCSEENVDLGII